MLLFTFEKDVEPSHPLFHIDVISKILGFMIYLKPVSTTRISRIANMFSKCLMTKALD